MPEERLKEYWNDIPIERENAATYLELCWKWNCSPRTARSILHELSLYDNGDDYILIRSSRNNGFYKTTSPDEIRAYKAEVMHRGRSIFATLKKINRVLR